MKAADIRKMSVNEIKKKLIDNRKDYMELRFQAVSGQLMDTSKLITSRRTIARLETILKEREMAEIIKGEK